MGKPVGRRALHKLSDREVKASRLPGYYGDGGGLWLQVSPSGTKSWIFRFTLAGRAREMGLGSLHTFSLAEARTRAQEKRKLVADGIDPIEAKRAAQDVIAVEQARAVTFKVDAEAYIEAKRAEWKNTKHAQQWQNTLTTYAYPHIGSMLVRDIEVDHVLACLKPIWTTTTETASRLRGRIEAVLDHSTALKHRSGDNPARWKGNLKALLAAPEKVAPTEHHAALPYAEAAAFMHDLREQKGLSARALEFTILTATRTGEAIGARWSEIDLEGAEWVIPKERMKAAVEHRVPLSRAAVRLLKGLQGLHADLVFPGARQISTTVEISDMSEKPLSNMAMLTLLQKRMGRKDLTVHGFRSTFNDWASETTSYPNEVIQMALAHTIEDAVEAAYRRGVLFAKRAKLMQAWADYLGRKVEGATVTPIRKKSVWWDPLESTCRHASLSIL